MPKVKPHKVGEGVYELDLRGLVCPYTVKFTLAALEQLRPGDRLIVIVDNPPSCESIPKDASSRGHRVDSIVEVGEQVWKITIIKQ